MQRGLMSEHEVMVGLTEIVASERNATKLEGDAQGEQLNKAAAATSLGDVVNWAAKLPRVWKAEKPRNAVGRLEPILLKMADFCKFIGLAHGVDRSDVESVERALQEAMRAVGRLASKLPG